jgi:hypothetical protein
MHIPSSQISPAAPAHLLRALLLEVGQQLLVAGGGGSIICLETLCLGDGCLQVHHLGLQGCLLGRLVHGHLEGHEPCQDFSLGVFSVVLVYSVDTSAHMCDHTHFWDNS